MYDPSKFLEALKLPPPGYFMILFSEVFKLTTNYPFCKKKHDCYSGIG
jgi:hypothetical protein